MYQPCHFVAQGEQRTQEENGAYVHMQNQYRKYSSCLLLNIVISPLLAIIVELYYSLDLFILVTSLYISIKAVQLLTMLGHHSSNNIPDGDHADHALGINHWNVSDTIIYKEKFKAIVTTNIIQRTQLETNARYTKAWETCHQLHSLQNFGIRSHSDQLVLVKWKTKR